MNPRPQTFDLLARTRNPAAAAALARGLTSTASDVRDKCLKLMLARPESCARSAIISEWLRLDATARQSLANSKFELQPACRELLQSGTSAQKQAAITAICDLDMTAALPELIPVALEQHNPLCDTAMQALFEFCDRWGQRARSGRDVPTVRTPMIDAMARVVYEYPMHKNPDLIDAWLVLVSWEDSAHRAIINDPLHPAYRIVLQRFWESQHQSILQLLGGYLWRGSTPKSVLSIICERSDHELAIRIASMLDENLLSATIRRLRELPPLACLTGLATRPAGVAPDVQRRMWLMLAANSTTIEPVLAGAVAMSKMGSADGRRMAAEIIKHCRRKDIESLVYHMQHAAANPDDHRSVGAHLQTILSWIDGPSTVLSAAAREFFEEFTLSRLLDVVRKLPAPLCRVMAQVVRHIEPDVVPQLLKALESPAPKKRIMALQVIRLLDVSSEINDRVLPLVHDSRVEVRVPAIDLLAALGAPELFEMLPELLNDPTTDVQDAALRAKRRLERRRRANKAVANPVVLPTSAVPTPIENSPC
ncbi:MAG: hypothetical protein IT423_10630 [Pirellulaceae bacterium]|nr:hypothetical protein [Pirellulaceae bacterium]